MVGKYAQSLAADLAKNQASVFKLEDFSVASAECDNGEIMCFRSMRTVLAHVSTQQMKPWALTDAIQSSRLRWRNINHSPITTGSLEELTTRASRSLLYDQVTEDREKLLETLVISSGYETLRRVRVMSHTGILRFLNPNAPITKESLELVHHINGTLLVTLDEKIRSELVTLIWDNTLFIDTGDNFKVLELLVETLRNTTLFIASSPETFTCQAPLHFFSHLTSRLGFCL